MGCGIFGRSREGGYGKPLGNKGGLKHALMNRFIRRLQKGETGIAFFDMQAGKISLIFAALL